MMIQSHCTSEGLYVGLESPGPILGLKETERFYPWPLLRSMGYNNMTEWHSAILVQLAKDAKYA